MTNLVRDLLMLVDIQNSLSTVQKVMKYDEAIATELSDVWNTLLDIRTSHLRTLVKNERLVAHGLLSELQRAIAVQMED
jgi:acyl-coenzyme A thioesterase PaaI-like protein